MRPSGPTFFCVSELLISDVGILEVVAGAGTVVDNALDLALDHPGLVGLS